jgi:hypothetical protein
MELIYSLGLIHLLKHDRMSFIVLDNTLRDNTIEVIGCYQDKHRVIKRIKRDSAYGKKILELLNAGHEEWSQDEIRLQEVIKSLVGRLTIDSGGGNDKSRL